MVGFWVLGSGFRVLFLGSWVLFLGPGSRVGLYSEASLMSAGQVPALRRHPLPLVGVGKHLCGAATGESPDP